MAIIIQQHVKIKEKIQQIQIYGYYQKDIKNITKRDLMSMEILYSIEKNIINVHIIVQEIYQVNIILGC